MNILGASRYKSRAYDYYALGSPRSFIELDKGIKADIKFPDNKKLRIKSCSDGFFVYNNKKSDYGYKIVIDSTSLNYGNRYWFNCPKCRRRCVKLYRLNYLVCRKCARITYVSTHSSRSEYLRYKIQKLRFKIWGNKYTDFNALYELSDFMPKPKWMKYSKFKRLRGQLLELEFEYSQLFVSMALKWMPNSRF